MISQEDMQNEDSKLRQLKIYTEEMKMNYQKSIDELQNSWNKLFQTFLPFIGTINKQEFKKKALFSSRIDFYLNPSYSY